jgi:hypothetical protein
LKNPTQPPELLKAACTQHNGFWSVCRRALPVEFSGPLCIIPSLFPVTKPALSYMYPSKRVVHPVYLKEPNRAHHFPY